MRKRKQGRTLSRNTTQRQALKRTMLVSLVKFGSIKTTLAKAKELQPFTERMITRAKKVDPKDKTTLPVVLQRLKKELPIESAKKLVKIAEGYQTRIGGYTRIIKLSPRLSDTAKMAIIEFVGLGSDKGEKSVVKSNGAKKAVKKDDDKNASKDSTKKELKKKKKVVKKDSKDK